MNLASRRAFTKVNQKVLVNLALIEESNQIHLAKNPNYICLVMVIQPLAVNTIQAIILVPIIVAMLQKLKANHMGFTSKGPEHPTVDSLQMVQMLVIN